MKIISFLYKEPWPRIIGIPLISLLISLSDGGPFSWNHFSIAFVFTFVFWNADYILIKRFRRYFPHLNETPKRLLYTIVAILFFNLLADFILRIIFETLNVDGFDINGPELLWIHLAQNFGTTFIIGTLYETGYYFSKWKFESVEVERIKSQQLKSELSVLKNQLSPHFLFNSLNTLLILIKENENQALLFTEKLSQVYRHILQVKEKEIIKLKSELSFIEAYIFLMKIRFEKSIEININVDKKSLDYYVAPLTIQMLVENALKHNIASISKPLIVDIYVENGRSLIVRNNLQPKKSGVNSTFTGLENIQLRYQMLSDCEVDIIETRDHFMVALPLIDVTVDEVAPIL